jgi:hypothetical protein
MQRIKKTPFLTLIRMQPKTMISMDGLINESDKDRILQT